METTKFFGKWYGTEFENCGGITSNQYEKFQADYKTTLREICKNINFELISFNKNHYQFSAVLRSNETGNYFYISIPDVRSWKNEWANNILYRTMKHEKDWTGGTNRYCTIVQLQSALKSLDI